MCVCGWVCVRTRAFVYMRVCACVHVFEVKESERVVACSLTPLV